MNRKEKRIAKLPQISKQHFVKNDFRLDKQEIVPNGSLKILKNRLRTTQQLMVQNQNFTKGEKL